MQTHQASDLFLARQDSLRQPVRLAVLRIRWSSSPFFFPLPSVSHIRNASIATTSAALSEELFKINPAIAGKGKKFNL
jgi:hypothetical protein